MKKKTKMNIFLKIKIILIDTVNGWEAYRSFYRVHLRGSPGTEKKFSQKFSPKSL